MAGREPRTLPTLWQAVRTEDGKTYYFNRETRQTSWTLPDERAAAAQVVDPRIDQTLLTLNAVLYCADSTTKAWAALAPSPVDLSIIAAQHDTPLPYKILCCVNNVNILNHTITEDTSLVQNDTFIQWHPLSNKSKLYGARFGTELDATTFNRLIATARDAVASGQPAAVEVEQRFQSITLQYTSNAQRSRLTDLQEGADAAASAAFARSSRAGRRASAASKDMLSVTTKSPPLARSLSTGTRSSPTGSPKRGRRKATGYEASLVSGSISEESSPSVASTAAAATTVVNLAPPTTASVSSTTATAMSSSSSAAKGARRGSAKSSTSTPSSKKNTQVIFVHLPQHKSTIVRVSPSMTMADLHVYICGKNLLDPSRYILQNAAAPDAKLVISSTVAESLVREVRIIDVGQAPADPALAAMIERRMSTSPVAPCTTSPRSSTSAAAVTSVLSPTHRNPDKSQDPPAYKDSRETTATSSSHSSNIAIAAAAAAGSLKPTAALSQQQQQQQQQQQDSASPYRPGHGRKRSGSTGAPSIVAPSPVAPVEATVLTVADQEERPAASTLETKALNVTASDKKKSHSFTSFQQQQPKVAMTSSVSAEELSTEDMVSGLVDLLETNSLSPEWRKLFELSGITRESLRDKDELEFIIGYVRSNGGLSNEVKVHAQQQRRQHEQEEEEKFMENIKHKHVTRKASRDNRPSVTEVFPERSQPNNDTHRQQYRSNHVPLHRRSPSPELPRSPRSSGPLSPRGVFHEDANNVLKSRVSEAVLYLGSVEVPAGEASVDTASRAIGRIKRKGARNQSMTLNVSCDGIGLVDDRSGASIARFSMSQIFFASRVRDDPNLSSFVNMLTFISYDDKSKKQICLCVSTPRAREIMCCFTAIASELNNREKQREAENRLAQEEQERMRIAKVAAAAKAKTKAKKVPPPVPPKETTPTVTATPMAPSLSETTVPSQSPPPQLEAADSQMSLGPSSLDAPSPSPSPPPVSASPSAPSLASRKLPPVPQQSNATQTRRNKPIVSMPPGGPRAGNASSIVPPSDGKADWQREVKLRPVSATVGAATTSYASAASTGPPKTKVALRPPSMKPSVVPPPIDTGTAVPPPSTLSQRDSLAPASPPPSLESIPSTPAFTTSSPRGSSTAPLRTRPSLDAEAALADLDAAFADFSMGSESSMDEGEGAVDDDVGDDDNEAGLLEAAMGLPSTVATPVTHAAEAESDDPKATTLTTTTPTNGHTAKVASPPMSPRSLAARFVQEQEGESSRERRSSVAVLAEVSRQVMDLPPMLESVEDDDDESGLDGDAMLDVLNLDTTINTTASASITRDSSATISPVPSPVSPPFTDVDHSNNADGEALPLPPPQSLSEASLASLPLPDLTLSSAPPLDENLPVPPPEMSIMPPPMEFPRLPGSVDATAATGAVHVAPMDIPPPPLDAAPLAAKPPLPLGKKPQLSARPHSAMVSSSATTRVPAQKRMLPSLVPALAQSPSVLPAVPPVSTAAVVLPPPPAEHDCDLPPLPDMSDLPPPPTDMASLPLPPMDDDTALPPPLPSDELPLPPSIGMPPVPPATEDFTVADVPPSIDAPPPPPAPEPVAFDAPPPPPLGAFSASSSTDSALPAPVVPRAESHGSLMAAITGHGGIARLRKVDARPMFESGSRVVSTADGTSSPSSAAGRPVEDSMMSMANSLSQALAERRARIMMAHEHAARFDNELENQDSDEDWDD